MDHSSVARPEPGNPSLDTSASASDRPQRQIELRSCARLLLAACVLAGILLPARALASPSMQSPASYLLAALTWLQGYDVRSDTVNWQAIRQQAQAIARHARTDADTYPSIAYAMEQLDDRLAGIYSPAQPNLDSGYGALYPDGLVVSLEPGGPAAHAGLRLGDRIELLNGRAPGQVVLSGWIDQGTARRQTLVIHRVDRTLVLPITPKASWVPSADVTGRRIGTLGYVQLPSGGPASYATQAQRVLAAIDGPTTCGWMIDLRQTWAGDIWTYLAAIGPILGNGDLGGFVYRDGTKQPWAYQNGRVFWNGVERFEDQIVGPSYTLTNPMPPVALLLDQPTSAAGELVAVAFAGRPGVRTFGQPTWGTPTFEAQTTLGDGTDLSAAGAYSYDRTGQTYRGPIIPDVRVSTDWAHFGDGR